MTRPDCRVAADRTTSLAAILILSAFTAFASIADDWSDIVSRSGPGYTFSVPRSWRHIHPKGNGPEHYLEASGIVLPITENNAPVIVTAFITTFPAESLQQAKQTTTRGYGENPDRVFPAGEKIQAADLTLRSGETALILNTRFYRKSKGLQQSRFDLVAFMPDRKRALLYTLSVQYSDETYALERKLQLRNLAEKMFERVSLDK